MFKKKINYADNLYITEENASLTAISQETPSQIQTKKSNPYSGIGLSLLIMGCFFVADILLIRYGYVSPYGEVEIEKNYKAVSDYDFVNGMALVENVQGEGINEVKKYGFINENYELVIPLIYDNAFHFQGDRALVAKDGKLGYINRKGRAEIPIIYKAIGGFRDGLFPVFLEEKGWGYIDWDAFVIIPYGYRDAKPFSDGLALVQDTRRYW